MSAGFKLLERQTTLAPLGVRFRDAATGAGVDDGLVVTAHPSSNPARQSRAFANRSGVYVLHGGAGLLDATRGAGDAEFWSAQTQKKPFVVTVADERGRYLPMTFTAELPARGPLTWVWPLADTTGAPPAGPALSFRDDFADTTRDASKWKPGTLNAPTNETWDEQVTVVEQGGRLEITPRASETGKHYNGYLSVDSWNATNARASVEVVQAAEGAAETIFSLGVDGNNWFRFAAQAGQLLLQTRVGGVDTLSSMAYDAAQHRWWRLRHDRREEQVIFETSADGAAWVPRRGVPRKLSLTALTVELGAGSASSVGAPGKAVFDNFALESNPEPAVPLYSAPTRVAPAGMAVLRAELWNPLTEKPAAFAMLEARAAGEPTARGFADRKGRLALVFPYPEPAAPNGGQTPPPPYTKQEWELGLRAFYAPAEPPPPLPEFPAALDQPRATLWADEARTTPLTKATLRAGRELIVRSHQTTTNAPLEQTPLPVLLITPAV